MISNPFVFARPVSKDKFVGREDVLRRLLVLIHNSESALVTGQPRIGKSSLLLHLHDMVRAELKGSHHFLPILISPGILDPNISELDFWRFVANSATKTAGRDAIAKPMASVPEVVEWFSSLEKSGHMVVVLIDGLGWLLRNEHLGFGFWATLRTIAGGLKLSLIAASRLTGREAQEQIDNKQGAGGSPALNIVIQQALYPFSYYETMELIRSAIRKSTDCFTPRDKRIVWQLSGGHPFLVQLTSSLIWDGRVSGKPIADDEYGGLIDEVIERADAHFWDTWRYISPNAQTIGLMMALREAAIHRKFSMQGLDDVLQSRPSQLRELRRTGLLQIENQELSLSSLCFGVWILRNLIGPGKEISHPEEWLRENQRILNLFTRKQLDAIASGVGRVYSELRETVLDLGSALARARLGLS